MRSTKYFAKYGKMHCSNNIMEAILSQAAPSHSVLDAGLNHEAIGRLFSSRSSGSGQGTLAPLRLVQRKMKT